MPHTKKVITEYMNGSSVLSPAHQKPTGIGKPVVSMPNTIGIRIVRRWIVLFVISFVLPC